MTHDHFSNNLLLLHMDKITQFYIEVPMSIGCPILIHLQKSHSFRMGTQMHLGPHPEAIIVLGMRQKQNNMIGLKSPWGE